MSLYFRCFHPDDFAFAVDYYAHEGDKTNFHPFWARAAYQMAGCVIPKTKINELEGAVTAENVKSNLQIKEPENVIEKVIQTKGEEVGLWINGQKGEIKLEVGGVGTWRIEIVTQDKRGRPERIRLMPPREVGPVPLFDIVRTPPTEEDRDRGSLQGSVRTADGRSQTSIKAYLKSLNGIHGWVEIDHSFIKISDISAEGTKVSYKEHETISDDEASRRIRTHEEQHLFNNLFEPAEFPEEISSLVSRALAKKDAPESVLKYIVRGLTHRERRWMYFDTKARDEVLAKYKEGRTSAQILLSLEEEPMYNYESRFAGVIKKLPRAILEIIKDNVVKEIQNKNHDSSSREIVLLLQYLEEKDIAPYVKTSFRHEYASDRKIWLQAITTLEEKGYPREKIAPLLYQEPINSWSNLARRMPNLKKS